MAGSSRPQSAPASPAPALDGLHVVELGHGVAAAYATKLLADLGAAVAKVEPPEGDRLRACGPHPPGARDPVGGGLFHYLNANKHSVVADLREPVGVARVRELLAGADVVVENFRPGGLEALGLAPHELLAEHPRLVVVRISNFGQDGPWRDRHASDLTLQAEVGLARKLRTLDGRPVHIQGRVSELAGGTFAAGAALAMATRATRTGQGTVVDLSLLEVLLFALSPSDVLADVLRELAIELPDRATANPGFADSADGVVGVSTLTGQQWIDLCALIGADGFESRMGDVQLDGSARQEFLGLLETWTRSRSTADIVLAMQEFRIPAAGVSDGRSVLELPQFTARGFFVPQPGATFRRPAAPYRLGETPVTLRSPAPVLDDGPPPGWPARAERDPSVAEDGAALPLAGVRVVDLTTFLSGGHLTGYLAAMGADVVKVESPHRPDGYRFVMTYPSMGDHWWERSPLWQAQNLSKRSVALDLRRADARAALERLLAEADVVAENYTARVLDDWDLGWDRLHALNPKLVMVRMPAFGLEGPWRDHVGFAHNIEQLAGMAQNGDEGGPFIQPYGIVDVINGQHAFVATVAALRHQWRTGRGQLVEVAQVETVTCLTADQPIEYQLTGRVRPRRGNRTPGCAPQGVYACRDGRWVGLTVLDDDGWRALVKEMDAPAWADRPELATADGRFEAHDELDARIGEWARDQVAEALVERLQGAGVAAAVLVEVREVPANVQLRARGFHRRIAHAHVGSQRYPRAPMTFSFGELAAEPAPTLGQHTAEVLRAHGVDDATIATAAAELAKGEAAMAGDAG